MHQFHVQLCKHFFIKNLYLKGVVTSPSTCVLERILMSALLVHNTAGRFSKPPGEVIMGQSISHKIKIILYFFFETLVTGYTEIEINLQISNIWISLTYLAYCLELRFNIKIRHLTAMQIKQQYTVWTNVIHVNKYICHLSIFCLHQINKKLGIHL